MPNVLPNFQPGCAEKAPAHLQQGQHQGPETHGHPENAGRWH